MVDIMFTLGVCQRNSLLARRVYAYTYPVHTPEISFRTLLVRFISNGYFKDKKLYRTKIQKRLRYICKRNGKTSLLKLRYLFQKVYINANAVCI